MTFAMGGAPATGSDRIPVELFQILKDDAVESAALNMQCALNMQYAGSRQNGILDDHYLSAVRQSLLFCLYILLDRPKVRLIETIFNSIIINKLI